MKVLSISTDRKLFEDQSSVLERSLEYSSKMEELYIIVFSLRKYAYKYRDFGNLHIYPTNSNSRLGYIFDAIKLGRKIISDNKFVKGNSVITTQDPFETGFVGYKLKKEFNFPLQIQIHTDFFSQYFRNSLLNKIRVSLAKFLIPKADGLRVVSSIIADSIKNAFPNLKAKIDVLPVFVNVENIINAQDTKNIKQQFSQFDKVIFMALRLSEEKRVDVALSIFKKIHDQFPKAGLVIAGTGPKKNDLENQAQMLGIASRVMFIGWQNDLISYYKTAEIFLLTSEYEGYGMTLIEAGAAGCPIVTTNVGIAKTDLFKNGENSFVCSVGDVDCLAKSVVDLIENPKKRKLFAERMQDSIRNTSISREKYVEKYVDLLQNLLIK